MIKRNFADNSKETMIPLYKSLVRPHLEYCWYRCGAHIITDIKLLEGVQPRATRLVSGMKSLCYADRLKNLGLTSFENRRIRSDLIETIRLSMVTIILMLVYFFNLMRSFKEVI